jgi:hypothetical protein
MKNCVVCRKEFDPRFYNEKTCSDECKFINQKQLTNKWKENHKAHLKESYRIKAKKYYNRHKEKFVGNKDGFTEKVRGYTHTNFEKGSECHFCATKDNLDFHHKVYEYPPSPLQVITLCRRCHLKLHALIDSISAEKDRIIKALQDDLNQQITYTGNAYQLGRKDCSEEKDKEIADCMESLRESNKELTKKADEIASLRSDAEMWKLENETSLGKLESLKKENPDMIFHNHIKAHFEKEHPDWKVICKICGKSYEDIVGEEPMTVQQALSELREIVNSLNCFQGSDGDLIYKEKVLKAIDRLKEGK